MGYRKSWDVGEILTIISRITRECTSSYNDGFTAFEAKKDLLEIKFFLEDCLERCSSFSGEEEIYQQRLIKKLKQ
jgi:hypothetical protein